MLHFQLPSKSILLVLLLFRIFIVTYQGHHLLLQHLYPTNCILFDAIHVLLSLIVCNSRESQILISHLSLTYLGFSGLIKCLRFVIIWRTISLPYWVFSTQSVSILNTDISWSCNCIVFPVHCFIWRFDIMIISMFTLLGL